MASEMADDMADEVMDDAMGDYDDMADGDMEAEAEDSSSPSGRGGPGEPEDSMEAEEEEAAQPRRPSDTTFEDYERAAFVSTDVDAVSTFSLDTDRTSYFLALTWVRTATPRRGSSWRECSSSPPARPWTVGYAPSSTVGTSPSPRT